MVKDKGKKAILQQISDVAWLVRQGKNKLGILNKDVQNKYFYINGKEAISLPEQKDVEEYFGNVDIFNEQIKDSPTEPEAFYIKGHLIDYETPYPLDPSEPNYDPDVPLYTKTPDSDIYYAAGWYCINFDKCWKHGHGPKYSTLIKYGFRGPFKTEEECKIVLKQINKERKLSERTGQINITS
jgi:hypothetical protein|tara:strand:- start:614 stop:1162 length:549 start_codon:yes stop_codon:yes gene_type:complete